MALVGTTSKLALEKPADGHDDWGQNVRDNYDKLESRLTQSNAGDPNGTVTSDFAGQWLWDTTNGYWWAATSAGVNNAWSKKTAGNADQLDGNEAADLKAFSVAMGIAL